MVFNHENNVKTQISYPIITIICIFIMKLVIPCYCTIKINKISVPPMALNGTSKEIILDCDFKYDNEDQLLVVKWFFENDATPIYQWLSEIKKLTVSDKWKNVVILDNDSNIQDLNILNKMFRKLKFRYVTIDMSGTYTCSVESMLSQASSSSKMIVYAPPRISSFNFERTTDRTASALSRASSSIKNTVYNNKIMAGYYGRFNQQQQQAPQIYPQQYQTQNPRSSHFFNKHHNRKFLNENNTDAILTCEINDVYPMPEVVIFRRDFNGRNPYALKIFQIEKNTTKNSAINLRVRSAINDNELQSKFGSSVPTVFECRVTVTINQENIQRTRQLLYDPSYYEANKQQVESTGFNNNSSKLYYSFLVILICIFNQFIMFKQNIIHH